VKRNITAELSRVRQSAILRKKYRRLISVCPELRCVWDHVVGSGVSGDWTIAGGDGSVKARFQALAERSASLLSGEAAGYADWLEVLRRESPNFRYGRETVEADSDGTERVRHVDGTILRVAEASLNYHRVLESGDLAAGQRTQQVPPGGAMVSEPASAKNARRGGRPPSLERRNAIRRALAKHGDKWRNHLPEILAALDHDEVPMERFYGWRIDLGEGKSQTACKWELFDLAVGKDRQRLVNALRRYVVSEPV
jgi:hypothetical protein